MGFVDSLWITPYSGEEPVSKTEIDLVKDRGIEGDRYFLGKGTFSALPEKGRQCTLISADSATKGLAEAGLQVKSIGSLRRNIAVRGLSGAELLEAVGREVHIGDVTLFVHRCDSHSIVKAAGRRK